MYRTLNHFTSDTANSVKATHDMSLANIGQEDDILPAVHVAAEAMVHNRTRMEKELLVVHFPMIISDHSKRGKNGTCFAERLKRSGIKLPHASERWHCPQIPRRYL